MDGMIFQVVEQICEELPQQELRELSADDLAQVGGGLSYICDPGVIIIEK